MVNGCASVMKNVTKAYTSREVVVAVIKHGRSTKLIEDKSLKNVEIPTKPRRDP
jgi:hypothetical protein